ncbi:MAG TPA: DUF4402 domain-containing protein [Gemmatimonadales bacterium]|nr:DUF4402 domain-containing protein [Gemmatimonadales bacterium]
MNHASRLILGTLALTVLATVAQAQTNNASIQATATVQQPINVTGDAALAFGNVFPGVAKTVAPTDAAAGHFTVTGQASANVNLTFTLPGSLSDGSGNTLPIATWQAIHNNTNVTAGDTSFTPSAGLTSTTLDATTGKRYLFIGATVSPASNQAAGAYSGTVTMTVVYF